jgi:lysophospholipase L1-like esterase
MAPNKQTGKRILLIFVSITLTVAVFEIGARLAAILKPRLQTLGLIKERPVDPSTLNFYQIPDPHYPNNWLLRPSYALTLQETIEGKELTGRTLAVAHLKERAAKLQIGLTERIFQINADGFKGPELDKTHSRLRILTIGDSCTFGTLFDKYSYPRTLERELRSKGIETEVVNAGVESYTTGNVLMRIEQFKALRPEIVTIYIGWNNLFGPEPRIGLDKYSYTYRLLRRTYQKLSGPNVPLSPMEEYTKAKHVDANAREVRNLEGFVPPFMDDVEEIIKQMQAVNSRVVIVTLPGLLSMSEKPTDEAVRKGQLPSFTDNPYVLAKLTGQYNAALRQMATRDGLQVIDLERWSETALIPRDSYFWDSIHPYEEGEEKIGAYMADEIFNAVRRK